MRTCRMIVTSPWCFCFALLFLFPPSLTWTCSNKNTTHIMFKRLNVLGVIALNMFKRFNNETCLDTLWINPSQHHSAECKFSTNNSSHLWSDNMNIFYPFISHTCPINFWPGHVLQLCGAHRKSSARLEATKQQVGCALDLIRRRLNLSFFWQLWGWLTNFD